jgi:type I restriction enzyme M protein
MKRYIRLMPHTKIAFIDDCFIDTKALKHYQKLTSNDVKEIVIEQKWMFAIKGLIDSEMERISQRLSNRIKELIERYESPLPEIEKELSTLEKKVKNHLQKMGFTWK